MAEISTLLEIFQDGKSAADLAVSLRSDSARPGLERFVSILEAGIGGCRSWTRPQIDAVVAVAKLIVAATRSTSAVHVDPVIVVVVEKTLEFCIRAMEEFVLDDGDFGLQNCLVQVMEIALADGTDTESTVAHCDPVASYTGPLSIIPVEPCTVDFNHNPVCNLQGKKCIKSANPVEKVFKSLVSELLQPDSPTKQLNETSIRRSTDSMLSLAQHWAVVHLKFLPRLFVLCKTLLQPPISLEEHKEVDANFSLRLSFSHKLLKLLGNLCMGVTHDAFDTEVLCAAGNCADTFPAYFRLKIEFVNYDSGSTGGNFVSLLLMVLEEYLQLVQRVFFDDNFSQNVQACLVASVLDILDSEVWRYDKSKSSCVRAPLIYHPQSVLFLLKLLKDSIIWGSQAYSWKEKLSTDSSEQSSSSEKGVPSCHIRSMEFSLVKKYTPEDIVRMIFPSSKQWVDALIHATVFLHLEVVRSRPKIDKRRPNCTKTAIVLELDSVASHEEDALFGDLFSEASRPLGPTDGLDQPTATTAVTFSSHNMLIQAAAELSKFLKVYIFSPEQNITVYEDASMKFDKTDVDYLLSILNCQTCISDEKCSESAAVLSSQRTLLQVKENCFGLLHNLLVHRVLSTSLVEHLVDQVTKVVNGTYIYNNYTLALLAHALISGTGANGTCVMMKTFNGYSDFILEKAKNVCLRFEPCEIFATLPTAFHLEILLMVFHLSNESVKVALAKSVFSSLGRIDTPLPGLSGAQLYYWTLTVSRLILVLRHMLLYPSGCPSWLLLRLKSRLRDISSRGGLSRSLNDHLPSSASIVAESILGGSVKDDPAICDLLPQLVDVAPLPSISYRDECSIQHLGLDLEDLIAVFSRMLDVWRGKMVEAVEQLVTERYIFILCWDTLSSITCGTIPRLIEKNNLLTLDIWSTESFYRFSLSLTGNNAGVCPDVVSSEVILNLLKQVSLNQSSHLIAVDSWDFFRMGPLVSVTLSLVHTGIWRYSVRHSIPGLEPYCVQHSKDSDFFYIAENLIDDIMKSNKGGRLLSALSTILKMYLEVLQKAVLSILDFVGSSKDRFSPLLLLKHTGFEKYRDGLLLEKDGSKPMQCASIFEILSKLDDIASKGDSGDTSVIFFRCLLHGFPSHLDVSSGAFLSCVLGIRDMMCALDAYLKIKDAAGMVHVETEVVSELLDTVMYIKHDKIFQSIHGKCEAIFGSLVSHQKELLAYSELFALKQVEGLLADINSNEGSDRNIQEILIITLVDFIEGLRRDGSKAGIFKFYLGCDEDLSEDAKQLFGRQCGDLLVLVKALDNCYSESVNLKVLSLFNDLLSCGSYPSLKEKIQKKFLEMDLLCLSSWVEKRLLGSIQEPPDGGATAKGSSTLVRESTMDFITHLVSQPAEILSQELHGRIIEAMLKSVDSAFLLYDIHTAKAYFSLLVRLLNGDDSMRQLLQKTAQLMEKLADNDGLLPGLKFVLNFLGAVLGDCGANRNASDKRPTKMSSSNGFGSGSVISKPASSRKDSESLVLPANQSNSASIDCDATSADEDEDDGTSDGELASVDKEEEEEEGNSERVLASKVCTFTSSGSNFMEQHWYFCYTCDLTLSKGCCSVCAKVCHRGHRVVYSRLSRFFCDCGAGGVRGSSCQCLKPRKFTGTNNSVSQCSSFQPFLPFPEDGDQAPDSDSDLDDDVCADIDNSISLSIPKEVQAGLPALVENLDIEGRVLELCARLLPQLVCQSESNLSKDKKVVLGRDKMLSYNVDLFQLKKAYKSGSLDLKIKADYPNSRELKSHLSSGSLTKSLLTVSIRGRLAAGEGDKVAIFDVGQLIGQPTAVPVTTDKANVKPLSRNIVRFEIVHLIFNPVVENYLAVAGYEECQVLTVNNRGEVTDRLAIELALQGAYIRRVEWVPGSQVQLMVVTNIFVKIYDLSQDNISPMHYFTLPDDFIVDAALVPASMGKVYLLVLSESGRLFRLEVSMEGEVGAKALTDSIQVQDRDNQPKALSLYYSLTYRLLFLSFQDGTSLLGRLNANATTLSEMSAVYEEDQDGKVRAAGLHHWRELLFGSGLFVCFSNTKSNAALSVSMGPNELFAQNMRYGAGSALPVVGVAACKPLSKDKTHCFVLHEDGSLQIYSHIPVGVDTTSNSCIDQTKKIRSSILKSRADAGSNPEFPLDFFEKTMCITPHVKFSSDAMKNSDSEGIKQRLSSDDGYLESPSTAGFKITVSNSNPDMVMVGFRIHVGNTSASHIPSEVTIFQRVIKLEEGMRSWYDIPFTVAESLLADEEFTISVGQAVDGSTMPRIDSLEVYGRIKDEFGWKEKMDAVLDMEARVLGTTSGAAGAGKKYRSSQVAPIQEQVMADALRLLSRVYLLCEPKNCTESDDTNLDLEKLKCKKFLDLIFESDREPLLRSAAYCVLQAVYPKREAYYYVKDTMRLLGVLKSIPILISRIGIGGAASTWVIKEFTAQMHTVSKIALCRRSNMVTFLEARGSGVVDGLMQVLWGILDLERPETQTINNIVIPSVELIYSYAECLALHGNEASGKSVAPAVTLLKKLLFAPYEPVQTSSSLAISSRLLQVPFPKQTMLITDDAPENSATAHTPSASAASGNAQVMIEDDSTTSSVQYCCDGCSTVPILRRRWHCNVCPDFDLCETCYEVLDADLLPPPHSRDHPMSAIPIEIDSLGGDGNNEIHFSRDDLRAAGVMQVAADVSIQNSPPSIHVMDSNETGAFPASVNDQRIVSISASKRAVNSFLLRHLVSELKGWMVTTSGVRAIPIMQLFYRLSSAVGGPFMDSSKPENLDLEKFVKWLLDEINLSKPFTVKTRSSFGEVVILVFMFFTLMLRNWHQPGSESSQSKSGTAADSQDKASVQVPLPAPIVPSSNDDQEKSEFASQLIRACSFLRQQAFLNYLMDILQQLVHISKSSSANSENGLSDATGCGSLLIVRRELPAGNFSPFFSDSYAKAHRGDIFMDYHKLLLENTFRLVYSLVRPEKHDKLV